MVCKYQISDPHPPFSAPHLLQNKQRGGFLAYTEERESDCLTAGIFGHALRAQLEKVCLMYRDVREPFPHSSCLCLWQDMN